MTDPFEYIGIGWHLGLDHAPGWKAGWYWLAYGDGQTVYSQKAHFMEADTGEVNTVDSTICGLRNISFDTPCKVGCMGCENCRDVLCKRCLRILATRPETPPTKIKMLECECEMVILKCGCEIVWCTHEIIRCTAHYLENSYPQEWL